MTDAEERSGSEPHVNDEWIQAWQEGLGNPGGNQDERFAFWRGIHLLTGEITQVLVKRSAGKAAVVGWDAIGFYDYAEKWMREQGYWPTSGVVE